MSGNATSSPGTNDNNDIDVYIFFVAVICAMFFLLNQPLFYGDPWGRGAKRKPQSQRRRERPGSARVDRDRTFVSVTSPRPSKPTATKALVPPHGTALFTPRLSLLAYA
jgi:hypothetical protein